jgi:hypothetical protein
MSLSITILITFSKLVSGREISAAPAGTAITEKVMISDRITANTFLDIGKPPYNYTH